MASHNGHNGGNGTLTFGASSAGPSHSQSNGFTSPPSSPPSHSATAHGALPANGYHKNLAPSGHETDIIHHLYSTGFQTGNYSDINLVVKARHYKLHAIILSRSPYLAHLISTSPSNTIYVPLPDESPITDEGFAIALGYLYSSEPLQLLSQADGKTARAALASALLLGGMDDLSAYAYEVCRGAISPETLDDWLHFLETIPSGSDTEMNQSIFGPFTRRLRDDIFTYLIVTLPQILQVSSSQQNGQTQGESQPVGDGGWNALLSVYSRLPFELFKDAVESPAFPITSDQVRFKFAKAAITLRKQQGISRDAEETVVLAFGGAGVSTSAVHITRKLKKRPLWKVTK